MENLISLPNNYSILEKGINFNMRILKMFFFKYDILETICSRKIQV